MKKIILLFSLVIGVSSFAQKNYAFNYMLLFDNNHFEYQKEHGFVILADSQDNKVHLSCHEQVNDLENYYLGLHDNSGKFLHTKVGQQDFYRAETLTSTCGYYAEQNAIKAEKILKYKFENLKDTIVNDTIFAHYVFKNLKKKDPKKRTYIKETHFVVYKNSFFCLPILSSALQYEVWKRDKNIPNGHIKIRYSTNYAGETIDKIELKKLVKVTKNFVIPKGCEPSKNPDIEVYR
jgi:hypothetical protein